jgi:phosphopantothenoylcysteine decarboxylase / phosphopantothenate---cysteine ligase
MSHHLRVLLGIGGGIAAYKSADLVRRLRERDVDVRVVMTEAATRFVTPLTLQALSGQPVRVSLWDEQAEAAMGHIELARWAQHILIAPATADLLARLATGQADDLLTTLCLASQARLSVAPAMNQQMWAHAATQHNVALLSQRGVALLGPAAGEQACGDVGLGRMLEPVELVERLLAGANHHPNHSPNITTHHTPKQFGTGAVSNSVSGALTGLGVVISAGPTREPIDPVRFITNRSSGKMGYAVAAAAAAQGARVVLISGPVQLATPAGVRRIDVETATEMRDAVLREIAGADIYIGAAAVADYQPTQCAEHKIKKSTAALSLCLERAPDILKCIQALPQRPFTVGFAAETQQVASNARIKLQAKGLDMIAANAVGPKVGFDADENELLVLWPAGEQRLCLQAKSQLAAELVQLIATRYHHTHANAHSA